MDVLDPSLWPGKRRPGPRGKAPLVEKALEVLGEGGMVRFTEADLAEVSNKSLALLNQSVARFANKAGLSVASRFVTEEDGTRAVYILRVYKRK